jgi:hypothetical protein
MSFFLRKKRENIQIDRIVLLQHLYYGCYCLALQQRKNDEVPFSQHDMILYIVLMLSPGLGCNFYVLLGSI